MDKKKLIEAKRASKRQIIKSLKYAHGCKRKFLLRDLADIQFEIDELLKDGG